MDEKGLKHGIIDLNKGNFEGYSPLCKAARENHKEIVELLLKSGANPNIPSYWKDRVTPLIHGHVDVMESLIRYGAKVDEGRESDGITPVKRA